MAKKRKRKQKKKKLKSGKNRTPISGHQLVRGKLLPPFAKLEQTGRIQLSSWINERLPEMLWAALIIAYFDRDDALGLFRRILNFIGRHEQRDKLYDLTLSGIAKLDIALRTELIRFITEPPETKVALSPLQLFDALPGRDDWLREISGIELDVGLLMAAVGKTLWHQSQEATDCRWLRVMAQVVSGKFHIPKEMADNWFKYPNEGDQRFVRPSIRAAEIAHNPLESPDLTWPNAFWKEAWLNTPCFELTQSDEHIPIENVLVTRQTLAKLRDRLQEHWHRTHHTTAIDPKHDAVFGMAFYSLRILDEMMGIGIGTSILGRLGLRTILEIRINLKYLLDQDNEELWKKWREFGAGQAKLNVLKFDELIDPPKYIDIKSLEQIANEDIWEEFLTVNLASWSGLDLRKLSERTGLKNDYDKHYSWTSGYAHGMWGGSS